MQFLKKEIFYPENYGDEESNRLIRQTNDDYLQYLDERRELFPQSLYSAYMKSVFFHDHAVKSVKIDGDAWCYGKRSDVVTLEIKYDRSEYTIVFDKVTYLKLLNEQRESCWVGNGSPTSGLEEIVLCEIRVLEDKLFAFEFLTSSGAIFEIHFQNVKVDKRKIYV